MSRDGGCRRRSGRYTQPLVRRAGPCHPFCNCRFVIDSLFDPLGYRPGFVCLFPDTKCLQGVSLEAQCRFLDTWTCPVSVKGNEYRKKAEEAEALAIHALDLHAADTYHQVARQYLELAKYADRQDADPRR